MSLCLVPEYSTVLVDPAVFLHAIAMPMAGDYYDEKRKVETRGLVGDGTRSVAADDVALGTTAARPTADRPRAGGTAPPRPRKKKKKR